MPEPSTTLPSRDQIKPEYKWKMEDIYATEDLWQADFDTLKGYLPRIMEYRETLSQSAARLADCLKLRDEISIMAGKLFAYARLHRDENTANAKYQSLVGKAEGLLADLGAASSFIEPEILALPDATLAQFRNNEHLADYTFYFDNLARQKQHVLSPAEEEILARAAEATQAAENIFNMLAHADMTFPDITDENGKTLTLSEGRYRSLIMSPDRRVRKDAFLGLFGAYNALRNSFAAILTGNVKKNIFYGRTRRFTSTLESALSDGNIPVNVYNNLLTTVNNNLEPLHRYVALKKKALKLDNIHMYDLYTPVAPNTKFNIPYPDGLQLVRDGLAPLGPEYAAVLNKGLTSGWIDVYENKGKQTGAYSWGVYDVHPFVLLNYNKRLEDVSTLAHEMGHAIHSYYSQASQPYATAEYTIFTAEVASTTNEILLNNHLLKTTADKLKKLYLVNQYLEMVRTTVYRQTLFAEFEKSIYEKAEEGETLTADLLDEMWHALNAKYYGSEIVIDPEINTEWARIPHFYWNFYVYQYVTGYAAATTLAEKMLTEDAAAQQRYINFLKSGGADYPITILKNAGVDMSTPQPVELTLNKFSSMLDELENLLSNS
ncbi:oligoendopeptidase F [Sporomusa acidovorans]|uniref:Oligopeptidase F n=1 Tax=Sporomusa acidovorans (strain ATCC 49682 / DSM 3132 / Mol) TaxID=1123286 RepID=A0ABZ3J535_SPOA4|nr:oligoendopeptidase F [Sporomusa acidovorans]OZC16413.1 oligoendopeptidase F, plasmid [Sporomusa acidovorans DSM 3132]SDE99358.1 oligopeptidase F. Metallo peptidase. MEROPS family M03B [Sporomusa acidovorans]